MTLKLVFTASLLDAQRYTESVENKPASLLVVPLGKALNGIPPSWSGRQMAGNTKTVMQVSRPIFCGLGLELKLTVLVSTWYDIGLVLSKLVSRPNIFRSLLHNVIIVFPVSAKCTILLHPHRPQQHANKTISQVLKQDQQTKFYPSLSLCAA